MLEALHHFHRAVPKSLCGIHVLPVELLLLSALPVAQFFRGSKASVIVFFLFIKPIVVHSVERIEDVSVVPHFLEIIIQRLFNVAIAILPEVLIDCLDEQGQVHCSFH